MNAGSSPITQQNLLVIEPMGASGEVLLRSVRRSGHRAIVATTRDVHRDSLGPVKEYIDEVVYVDFSDASLAVGALVDANEDYHFVGVVVSWEFLTDIAAVVADTLGLRGPVPHLARARRNKHAMADVWSAAGVPVPRLLAAIQPNDWSESDTSNWTYPLVIKPAENSASFGVSVVGDPSGVHPAITRASEWTHEFPHGIPFDRTVLVQEYLPGQEFSVEAISDRGRFFPWGVTMKFTTDGDSRAETGHIFPAPIAPELEDRILEVARAATEALGVTDGISHTEIKIDESGAPRLIESGPRPAGDFIPELVALATGQSPTDVYVHQAVEGLPNDFNPARPHQAAGINFFRTPEKGTFESLEFPSTLSSAEINRIKVSSQPGETVAPGSTNMDRIGWAIVTASDGEAVRSALDELQRGTRVTLS